MMVTHWKPTLSEIHAIIAGHPVEISIMGRAHPPIKVGVSDSPEDAFIR